MQVVWCRQCDKHMTAASAQNHATWIGNLLSLHQLCFSHFGLCVPGAVRKHIKISEPRKPNTNAARKLLRPVKPCRFILWSPSFKSFGVAVLAAPPTASSAAASWILRRLNRSKPPLWSNNFPSRSPSWSMMSQERPFIPQFHVTSWRPKSHAAVSLVDCGTAAGPNSGNHQPWSESKAHGSHVSSPRVCARLLSPASHHKQNAYFNSSRNLKHAHVTCDCIS